MKCPIAVLLASAMLISLSSCGQGFGHRALMGEPYAKAQVRRAVVTARDSVKAPHQEALLKTKEMAVAVAEPILFNIYGKSNIVRQRPYELYLIDGYWFITGTIPEGSKGGVFEIIIDASNSRVLDVTHGK